ncbi:hypothetical protein [Streptomyces microflavus]|uniref:hypothetical protein n=1 Tax=Streptomyces microflavus TaxID=1919 RepID=UPI002F915EFF|nr:hypothetical protein OH770_35895 [Streptomyces microflavus]
MPKKRKKNRKASRDSTNTVTSRASLPAQLAQAPDWEAEYCDDEDFPMSAFQAQFARPADAVAAVRAGERWEWIGCADGSRMRHRILASDDGTAVVEQAVFLGTVQEGAILCAWHETPEDERPLLEKSILSALDCLQGALRPHLEEEIREGRGDDYAALVPEAFSDAPEPHGPGIPLFGWRILHPVAPETTWDDTVDIALWNSSLAMDWSGHYDHIDEVRRDGFTALLHRHDVPAVLCTGCEKPITSRHPRWPGIWVTPTDEGGGAACEGTGTEPFPPAPRIGWYTDSEFGTPHQPQSAS